MINEVIYLEPEKRDLVAVPAEYDTVSEKVLVREEHVEWKKGKGPIQKVDEIIHSEKYLLAVVHREYVKPYRKFGILIQITTENRDLIINRIIFHILGKNLDTM